MPYSYRVHGLRLRSDLELPELRVAPADDAASPADVVVCLGPVPFELAQASAAVEGFQIGAGEVLLDIAGVARYLARGGDTLIIDPAPNADPGAVRLFLQGSGLAAILHQRGDVPLHACAVDCGGHSMTFIGDSGAGKSTLVALLARRGFPIVADDVLVARPDASGTIMTEPSVPVLKLWPESLPHSDYAGSAAPFEIANLNKHRIDAQDKFVEARLPLTRLYVLRWLLPASAAPEIVPLSPFEAMLALRPNVYRPRLAAALGREAAFMGYAGRLLPRAGMFEFRRARALGRAEEQIDELIAHMRAG